MPTGTTGKITPYTDTTPQVRCVEPLINNISPAATPLVKLIGINSLNDVFNTTYEWLNDELPITSAVVDATGITTTNSTQFGLATTADSTMFQVGHLIEVDDEVMRVSASDYAGTLTVTRGYGSTTQATHAAAATVHICGIAYVTGADATTGFSTDITSSYNYVQTMSGTVEVTGEQQAVKQYGKKNEMSYQVPKKFKEMAILLEKNIFRGRRQAGSSSVASAMGGLHVYVTDNTATLSSAQLQESHLTTRMRAIFSDTAEYMPDLLVCHGYNKVKISSFYAPYHRVTRTERTGGVVVDRIETDFGEVDVLLDIWCPESEIWFLRKEFLGLGPMNNCAFREETLGKKGFYEQRQVVGVYTLAVRNDKAHGLLYGTATS